MNQQLSYYLPLGFAITGTILYHLSQKMMPSRANAFLALAWACGLACLLSLALWRFTVRSDEASAAVAWPSIALGFALVAIEAGYLFAYRIGWQLNRVALAANVCVAIVLLVIGTCFFREQMTFRLVAGIASCLFGLALLIA